MALITQASWVFSHNSISGVSSSKTNLSPLPNFRLSPTKTHKLLASSSNDSNSSDISPPKSSENEPVVTDPVKLAFLKAKAYKKKSVKSETDSVKEEAQNQNPVQKLVEFVDRSGGSEEIDGGSKEIPVSIKLSMQKAREYKNRGSLSSSNIVEEKGKTSGLGDDNAERVSEKIVSKKKGPSISSIDFVGLGFADKKNSRGLPAGLVPMVDSYSGDDDIPEVEFIVGDTSKFAPKAPEQDSKEDDDSDVYKPKVSTWGVFPRPSNISKTFGGGRVIRPGEILETSEDKAAKDAQTKKLLTAYKNKVGLVIDPKLKSECEKALKEGDDMMDIGKLKQALPFYEKVMKDLAFQNELHGLAALQWSICLDSLSRSSEARVMYEKLQSHPNVQVRKKAQQLSFSFQAMEMMKVTSSSFPSFRTGYKNYFDAFVEDKTSYSLTEEEEDNPLSQAIPYILFLLSPIFIVLLIAAKKDSTENCNVSKENGYCIGKKIDIKP